MSLITGLFFPVLLLNRQWSPPLTLQASHCSTFHIMCDVPSTAVFCSESIECFPGTASKFFLKLLVTIPVAPIITGTIVHFRFHICCISIHKLLYFNFCSTSFCTTFLSAGIATSISVHVFFFLFLIIISGLSSSSPPSSSSSPSPPSSSYPFLLLILLLRLLLLLLLFLLLLLIFSFFFLFFSFFSSSSSPPSPAPSSSSSPTSLSPSYSSTSSPSFSSSSSSS